MPSSPCPASAANVHRNGDVGEMANIPSSDLLHASMSGDDADPAVVLTEIQKRYQEISCHDDCAKFG